MNKPNRLRRMARIVMTPTSGTPITSVAEWMERYGERFRDGGFSPEEIAERAALAADEINLRNEAKTVLTRSLLAHNPTNDEDINQLLTSMLIDNQPLIAIKAGRDMARYRRHIAYFSRRSAVIREAYKKVARRLRDNVTATPIQAMFAHSPNKTSFWSRVLLNSIWWAPRPEALGAFYAKDDMVVCHITGVQLPRAAAIPAVYNEAGVRTVVHPRMIDEGKVRRDISGQYVVVDAVEWVTLDSGEQAWRSHNTRAEAIYYDDDEECWVRSSSRGGLASYHGARRQWRENRAETYRNCIGVELEIGFKSSGQQAKFLNRFVDDRGRFLGDRPFLVESDSSLSGITGAMEIISEPLPLLEGYQAADAHWRWLLTNLASMGAEGWRHRDKAGIHVNMDVNGRPARDTVRFIAFINNAASLSRFISGRKRIYGAHDTEVHVADTDLRDIKKFVAKDKHAPGGGYSAITKELLAQYDDNVALTGALHHFRSRGKYQPVHVRQNGVLEVRIFGSNIRYEGFMACVEYCVAGMAFTTQLPSNEAALHPEIGTQFREWLSGHVAEYPNLASRIGVEGTTTVAARPLEELVA